MLTDSPLNQAGQVLFIALLNLFALIFALHFRLKALIRRDIPDILSKGDPRWSSYVRANLGRRDIWVLQLGIDLLAIALFSCAACMMASFSVPTQKSIGATWFLSGAALLSLFELIADLLRRGRLPRP